MAGEGPDKADVGVALDNLERELAAELPAHMRAFARAHAEGRTPPRAPLVTQLASTLDTAFDACRFGDLADRGIALLRLVAPLAIEDDPAVFEIRAEAPSWDGLARLASVRDAAARGRFSCGAVDLVHRLNGVGAATHHDAPGPAIEGWHEPGPALDHAAITDAWHAIATRLGVTGQVRIDRGRRGVQPRTFVIDPRVEVIVVVPDKIDTPAARFAVLHELGHAVAALALFPGVPRAVDEAAASYVARLAEPPSWLPPRWASELAVAARRRRTALAAMLDEVERGLPTLQSPPGTAPPWALWHDPGAQGSYVAAETLCDELIQDIGPKPPRGQLIRALAAARDRIDHKVRL